MAFSSSSEQESKHDCAEVNPVPAGKERNEIRKFEIERIACISRSIVNRVRKIIYFWNRSKQVVVDSSDE